MSEVKKEAKEEKKDVTTEERIKGLKEQQEQLKDAFLKVQGAIEILQAIEKEKA